MKHISIVTPTYQAAPFLKILLDSCTSSRDRELVHIFCDNCSTDDAVSIILKECHNKAVIWASEEDSGPAQAINRGFLLADTEIIAWINADDYYADGAIDRALDLFDENPNLKFIYGHAKHVNLFGQELGLYPSLAGNIGIESFKNGNFVCQPTIFFKKEILKKVGYLDETLKTAFDFDWFIRIFKAYTSKEIYFIDDVQAYSRLHDQCLTKKYRQFVMRESIGVIHKHFGNVPLHWLDTYLQENYQNYPFVEYPESLSEHIQNMVQSVKVCFDQTQLNIWQSKVFEDARLRYAERNFFITVEPDGWTKDELIIKARVEPNKMKLIKLYCEPQWPFLVNLNITILSLWDGEETHLQISSEQNFLLELELPDISMPTQFVWKLYCDQTFVPAVVDPQSHDCRSLAIKILDVECI